MYENALNGMGGYPPEEGYDKLTMYLYPDQYLYFTVEVPAYWIYMRTCEQSYVEYDNIMADYNEGRIKELPVDMPLYTIRCTDDRADRVISVSFNFRYRYDDTDLPEEHHRYDKFGVITYQGIVPSYEPEYHDYDITLAGKIENVEEDAKHIISTMRWNYEEKDKE